MNSSNMLYDTKYFVHVTIRMVLYNIDNYVYG